MSKKTLFLIFALFTITSVLLLVALYEPYSKPPPTKIAVIIPEPIAQTTLLFGEPSIATSSSVSVINYSIPINIATGKNKVTAVQLELQYDPKILTNVAVIPGSFFKDPQILINKIDVKTGRISFAFGVGLKDTGSMGKDTVATISFSVRTAFDTAKVGIAQQTAIFFLPKTFVIADGITDSVLKQTSNALFSVGSAK